MNNESRKMYKIKNIRVIMTQSFFVFYFNGIFFYVVAFLKSLKGSMVGNGLIHTSKLTFWLSI